jgi:hypothetical protein
MSRKNEVREQEELYEDFDLSDDFDSDEFYPDDSINNLMSGLLEASNQQMMMAVELTKLIIAGKPSTDNLEEQVFSTYKKATQVIGENFALKNIMAQLNMD